MSDDHSEFAKKSFKVGAASALAMAAGGAAAAATVPPGSVDPFSDPATDPNASDSLTEALENLGVKGEIEQVLLSPSEQQEWFVSETDFGADGSLSIEEVVLASGLHRQGNTPAVPVPFSGALLTTAAAALVLSRRLSKKSTDTA